jgi:hypothetical protein
MARTLIGAAAILSVAAIANAATLLEEKFPTRNRLDIVGFELTKPGEITIDAAGLGASNADELVAYAWIIDHQTRKVVWEMQRAETDRSWGKKYLRKATQDQVFSRGKYELYIYTGDDNIWIFENGKSVVNAIGGLFSGSSRSLREQLEDCYVKLESNDIGAAEFKTFDPEGNIPGALIAANQVGDDEYLEKAFTLDKPMNLHVYMLLEDPSGYDTPVDFGWIMNADTRETVWSAAEERSLRAGGGKKNRKVDSDVNLPKGNYILCYTTDDSHSYRRFNVAPPYDPMNWGVTITPGTGFEPAAFHLATVPPEAEPLLAMTEVGDDESRETRFTLTKETRLRIRALGEWSSGDDEFVDYGWIETAGSGRVVWEMTDRNTRYAGGADKNRIFEGEITLPAGDYIVSYVTDDSHSYEEWNSGHPWLESAWGIALYPGQGFDKAAFKSTWKVDDNRYQKKRSRARGRSGL